MKGSITTRDLAAAAHCRAIAQQEFARLGFGSFEWRRPSRTRAIAQARAEVAFILRGQQPRPSLPLIARCVGVSDHTSVIHAIRAHAERIRTRQVRTGAAGIPDQPAQLDPVIRVTPKPDDPTRSRP